MALTSGTHLGPYEIISPIGAGGMGEVYRARDSKLGRDVALKVLLPSVADDPDRLARFRREAHVLASLNHQNIAQIHGFEDSGATHALVMELVEGVTLAELIEGDLGKHGLPLAQCLAIARQIADALSAAHDQGIVHRDLKPANVKVRDDGTVKVLDFGLAKAMSADAGSSSAAAMNSPTLTGRATQLGMIIGTAAYMAPEQAKGRAVDRRADVWAFGVVVFEMLAGRRAFGGDDISEILASVLKTDPDWSALPADTPPAVRRLLRRCLERDPKRRLRDIGEGMLQLDEALTEPPAVALPAAAATVARAPLWRRAVPVAIAVVVTAGVMALASALRSGSVPPPGVIRFAHTPPLTNPLRPTAPFRDLAVSHDGRTIVYGAGSGSGGGISQLFVRTIDKVDAVPLRGAESAVAPFFSADDAWVGFIDQSDQTQIKKVSIFGGPPMAVCTLKSAPYGATWTVDGAIIVGSSRGLLRYQDGGGDPLELTKTDATAGDTAHAFPSVIPGTPAVLFTTGTAAQGQIAVLDKPGGRITRFKIAGTAPRFLPSGHIAYAAPDGSLRVVPFDLARFEITGNPVPVDVTVAVKFTGAADFDVARDGVLVYAGGLGTSGDRTLVWVDRTGHETAIAAPPRSYFYARVSPDGARLSLDIRDDKSAIWIWDARGSLTRLTSKAGSDQYGLWNPDGEHVIGASVIGQKNGLFQSLANATGDPELILEQGSAFPNAVTPDGKSLIFRAFTGPGKNDLMIVPLTGDHVARPLVATEHDELNAAISRDGKWLAYQSDLSGREEVYVRPFPDVNANQWPVSTAGGSKPVWSRDGSELFYVSNDALMSVAVTTTRGFSAGVPAALFPLSGYFFGGVGRNFDLSADGKRFVMVKNLATLNAGSAPIIVVLNWIEDVKARAGKK